MKIFEIQNTGKGIITTLVPANLKLFYDSDLNKQSLDQVIGVSGLIPLTRVITANAGLYFYNPTGGEFGIRENSPDINSPYAYIGRKRDNPATDVSLLFLANETLFRDGQNNRGIEYEGDYEDNFSLRTLVTKQYVTSQIAAIPPATGSETKVNAGANISVTGIGTIGNPYVINSTIVVDGSETKLINGVTTIVSGNGTLATPYKVETVNLQKSIVADYILVAADNNYSIKVDNAATPITITVPSGLPENFFVGVTQKGTADVTIISSGTTLNNPIGFKIQGQGFFIGIEQIGTSNVFDILANTKP